MSKVKVAIAGIGSCASSLVQLVEMAKNDNELCGIMYDQIGGYEAKDIEFVAAFDVDQNKVGKDLSSAIFSAPNVAVKHTDVSNHNVTVVAGPVLDGIDGSLEEVVALDEKSNEATIEDVIAELQKSNADVLVCYLPTGSYNAVRMYAQAAVEAKVAFVNGTPEPVANDPEFVTKFENAGVALLGDDMRSHMGATTMHTALIELLHSRGITIDNTYQLNFGGNTDFLNLASPNRSKSKQKSKRKALNSAGIDASKVAAGPNGYVDYLGDNKVCYLRLEGSSILDSNISIELRLEVEDSPNSAGVIISAVRAAKAASDRKMSGVIDDVCALLFKSAREGATESAGVEAFNKFISESKTVTV